MAFWSKKEPEFEEMAEQIEAQPGISASELARRLGVPTINRHPAVARHG